MTTPQMTRRRFIGTSAAASTVYALLPHNVIGANERVNVGVIGMGTKGGDHIKHFPKTPGAKVVAVCDPDSARAQKFVQPGNGVQDYRDLRKLIENKDIDAVIIATPNHWHSLAAIWAMQAGKHAYVEKPVSHTIWESRQMVKAARKYKRICQAGTQQRSCPAPQAAARDIAEGRYGKVLWVHCSKLGSRAPIGKIETARQPPATCDYDLWAGPGPMTPVMRKQFHYDWHWQFDWGDGEMGNWGPHYVDDLRHLLGWDDVPTKMMSAGGRFWDDNGDTPNMHIAYMEHRDVKVVIDIRNMADAVGGSSGALYRKSREGNFVMCEKGYIQIARGGGKGFDLDGNKVAQYKGNGGGGHVANFFKAIQADDASLLKCDIEIGHQSTMMCHLANISYRLGKASSVDAAREAMAAHEDTLHTIEGMVPQLELAKTDFSKTPFMLGPELTFDNQAEQFTGPGATEANALVRTEYRKGFEVPEKV
jgi:predicted dehydrogenase